MSFKFCYFILISMLILNYSTQSYFEDNLIEEPCQKKCRCKHRENSSKIQVAHCTIDQIDNYVECNVEWPVLFMTIHKVRFDEVLLSSCQRIKRIMIKAESSLVVLMPEMFKYNSQLEILVVQAPIQAIESQLLKHLTSLKELDISETRIEQLSKSMFQECSAVEQIRLSSNQIFSLTERTFENCIKLKKLDLSHNKLTAINSLTFNKADNLQILDLSKNKIVRIEDFSFKNLKKLKILNLNNNILKSINKDTFSNLENLTKLSLASNQIDFIDDDAFVSLKKIKLINLRNNLLQRLDLVLFLHLNSLNISITNIKCVVERNSDYLLVSNEVRKVFEKFPLCSGKRNRNENIGNGERLIYETKKPEIRITGKWKQDPISFNNIFESYPYLFPMVFGGLAVLLISIIVIAVVCHVKNKQINELRLQEIHLPMMQSTL